MTTCAGVRRLGYMPSNDVDTTAIELDLRLQEATWLVFEHGLSQLPEVVRLLRGAEERLLHPSVSATRDVIRKVKSTGHAFNVDARPADPRCNVIWFIHSLAWCEVLDVELHGDAAAALARRIAEPVDITGGAVHLPN